MIWIVIIFIAVFLWMYFSGYEDKHTLERAKSSLGCTFMFFAFALMFIIGICSFFNTCSKLSDESPGLDYYDGVRK